MCEADGRWLQQLRFEDFAVARDQLAERVRTTPVWQVTTPLIEEQLGTETRLFLKLELFQVTATFKPRGALLNMLAAPDLSPGVTAVSAGNHAVAVAYAARALGTNAKVVMLKTANAQRVALCRQYGAEVSFAEGIHDAFERVRGIEEEEGRVFIHPFEGRNTVMGTGTLGWEVAEQVDAPDYVVVPIGGGGLAAGVSAAVALRYPNCKLIGVEPVGADSMTRSLAAGEPQSIERVTTIADSLGAPHAAPLSFATCQEFLDRVVLIDDDQLRSAMRDMLTEAKLAVEPAGAAAWAAILGPLRQEARGKKVVAIVCGANIDAESFAAHITH